MPDLQSINTLHPYPEYKDSGLPWLEKIPSRWTLLRGKSIFNVIDIRSKTGREELLTVSSADGVVPRSQKTVTMFMAKSYIGHKLCWPGDLVINSLWAWMQGLGFSKHHGLISSAYSVYRPRPAYTDYWTYFHYLLRSAAYKWELQTRSKGVWISRLQLLDSAFLDMPIIIPNPEDISAIVRFLDHTTRQIDRYIRAKKRMITLLNEQKQAIIHQAVTRGLDPNVPLKPSGIPWLGDIPAHWDTPLFGRCLTRIEQGWSPVAAEGELMDFQWCVLTLSSVRRGRFNPTAIKPVSLSATIPSDIQVRNDDLLLTRSNTRDRVGDVCLVKNVRPQTLLCDLIYRLSLRTDTLVPQFIVYQLLCPLGRRQIEKDARGSSGTMPKISQGHIKSWRVVLPPREEQQQIVQSIENKIFPIDTTISRAEQEITLMREYRTRLIADVVTGQLDVRAAAAHLPAIVDTPTTEEIIDNEEDELEETDTESEEIET